jgi:uncharacterized protein YqhQ
MNERIRLGGMALANGVLVHGPEYWACAVRTDEGELKVASGRKPLRAREMQNRLLQAPLRIAEIFALFPAVRRGLPEARLPYERPGVAVAIAASAFVVRGLRASALSPVAQEALATLAAIAPAALSLRNSDIAEYHGAEHISIGTYEHGEPRDKEHERCGSHLVGPLMLTSAAGSLLARLAPPQVRVLARAGAAVGALAASVEVFSWMLRIEKHPVARALAKPGHELQHRLVTAEPSVEQLAVANAALAECLRLEVVEPAALQSGRSGNGDQAEAPPPT